MTGYGQFCSVARAHEVLGGRWTLLIVRELLCGSRRFNDIRRGIPRVSRTFPQWFERYLFAGIGPARDRVQQSYARPKKVGALVHRHLP